MASRHDIVQIDFRANAARANPAIDSLRASAAKSRKEVERLRNEVQAYQRQGLDTSNLEKQLSKERKTLREFEMAEKKLVRGVRVVDQAIEAFNNGTLDKMPAAFQKSAINAVDVVKSKLKPGMKDYQKSIDELNALQLRANQNLSVFKANINGVVTEIKNGSAISKAELSNAKATLESLMIEETRGTKAWKQYSAQLGTVTTELNKLTAEEQRAAGQNLLGRVFRGDLINASTQAIEKTIAKLREYQSVIKDPNGSGARHVKATEKAILQLTNQLDKAKDKITTVRQALQAINSGTASVGSLEQSVKVLEEYRSRVAKTQAEWDKHTARINRVKERIAVIKGEVDKLGPALRVASTAGTSGFTGTAQQLTQAQQTLERAISTADKGSAKYLKLQQALARVNAEMAGAGMTSKQMQEVLANPKGVKSVDTLKNAVSRARAELEVMGQKQARLNELMQQAMASGNTKRYEQLRQTLRQTSKQYDELAASTKRADEAQKQLASSSKGSATAFSKAWSRLKTYIGLYVGAAVAMQKIIGTLGDIMTLSDKMGEVRKTTGFTADEVGRLSENLKKLDVRTSLTDLLDVSARAGQLGLKSIEDVQGFTEAANKLMIALPEMGTEAATEMMKVALATGEVDKIRKQMQQGLIEGDSAVSVALEKVGSTIDQLRANSAAAAPAITDFVKRVGAVGAQSGISIDQVAALGATVDGLGMRVEMSATALSRMIPAIKNNAFDVARAIGMAPNELRKMFEKDAEGISHGMDAIIQIFEHIRDKGMSAEDIETMLGKGGMQEIMKELNQQGARAGIVFAGLSQNVDLLKQNLNTATVAYEENMAVQREFEKMNETTAAKWARLKNEFEEMFVGDGPQKFLGAIVDGLRSIVDFLSGRVSPALGFVRALVLSIAAAWTTFRLGLGEALFVSSIGNITKAFTALKTAVVMTSNIIKYSLQNVAFHMGLVTAKTKEANKVMQGVKAAQLANVWMAVAAAIAAAFYALYKWYQGLQKFNNMWADLQTQLHKSVQDVNALFGSLEMTSAKQKEATKTAEDLKKEEKRLEEQVGKLRKKLGEGAEKSDEFRKAQRELERAHRDVAKAEGEASRETERRRAIINNINVNYSKYLGYMLTEANNATIVANAHATIISKLQEEWYWKQKLEAWKTVQSAHQETLNDITKDATKTMNGILSDQGQQKMWNMLQTMMTRVKKTDDGYSYGGKTYNSKSDLEEVFYEAVKKQMQDLGLNSRYGLIWNGGIGKDGLGDWVSEQLDMKKDIRRLEEMSEKEAEGAHETYVGDLTTQVRDLKAVVKSGQKSDQERGEAAAQIAAILKKNPELGNNVGGLYIPKEIMEGTEQAVAQSILNGLYKGDLKGKVTAQGFMSEEVRKNATIAANPRFDTNTVTTPTGGSATPKSIYGTTPAPDSTDYGEWNVDELVARRNQMDKFKNVLRPGVDVRAVLAEDKALMKALDNGLAADWKSVLEWYNTERLKIQNELKSERHSGNTGHWLDVKTKKGTKRKNRFRESDYALAELDRYYSKRKEELEQARIEENMTEETFNRQAELLEQEHLERRSKLRETFTAGNTKDEREMVQQFRQWWKQLQKQGELDEVPWATVESEWSKAIASDIGRNNLNAQKDLTELRKITVKHLNEIAKLVDKERPYDGITANLRQNLTKMDVLLADMVQEGPEADTKKLVKAETERLQFLLGEAEHAYSLTFDQLAARMREKGFGSWVDALMVDEDKKQQLMQNLRNTYDQIQEAIKKEASVIKKQLETQWNDILPGTTMSMKDTFEKAISDLGLQKDSVSRANSLIGAGAASERVADKLAIKQMQMQLQMQQTYYLMMQKIGQERVRQLEASAEAYKLKAKANREKAKQLRLEGKEADAAIAEIKARQAENDALQASFSAQHAQTSLNLAKTKELVEEEKQRVAIANQLEESQNRLYTVMKEWADLFASSLQSVFEASHTGEADYYNELAKLNLTGKGGPGAGTYIVIEHEGTDKAEAHYEYLDEREALERQLEIERKNAQAEAWKKVVDDLMAKMNDQITDWFNAAIQNASTDANTDAVQGNTIAIMGLTNAIYGSGSNLTQNDTPKPQTANPTIERIGYEDEKPVVNTDTGAEGPGTSFVTTSGEGVRSTVMLPQVDGDASSFLGMYMESGFDPETLQANLDARAAIQDAANDHQIAGIDKVNYALQRQFQQHKQGSEQMAKTSQSTFAKMIQAANLYGIAYQTMSNDNLSTEQKFQMMALQAAGQAAMAMMTANMFKSETGAMVALPQILAECLKINPIAGAAIFAVLSALIGGAIGVATSKLAKGKSEVAQVTGASGASAGRLTTGMMTYAEGNVDALTDPSTLTPGRSYNVDAADGKTYRARYTGSNPRTHIANRPEFHLVGEAGPEAIIDAKTTRQIRMDENGIWHTIQTLSNGGRLPSTRRMRRGAGMRAFADGNLDDFEEVMESADIEGMGSQQSGMSGEQAAALTAALDRQNDLLEHLATYGVKGHFDPYGRGGLVDSYDRAKKELMSHGEKY